MIESVITSSVNFDALILSKALPVKTPCVTYEVILLAPKSIILSAALQIVPAESMISSRIIQSFPFTSPMIFITSLSPALGLLLSTIAIEAPILFAIALALTTPPISGETATRLLISYFFDNTELGIYGFASNFFKGVRVIGVAISIITLPKIATSYSKGDFESMLYFARAQQWVSFALMIISSVVAILLVFEFFPLFMPDYLRSLNLIIILLIVASLLPLSKYANILNVIGEQGLYLKAQIFIILTNIIFSVTLINFDYGIEGVAIASLFSMAIYVSLIRYLGSKAIKNLISKV